MKVHWLPKKSCSVSIFNVVLVRRWKQFENISFKVKNRFSFVTFYKLNSGCLTSRYIACLNFTLLNAWSLQFWPFCYSVILTAPQVLEIFVSDTHFGKRLGIRFIRNSVLSEVYITFFINYYLFKRVWFIHLI